MNVLQICFVKLVLPGCRIVDCCVEVSVSAQRITLDQDELVVYYFEKLIQSAPYL